MGSIRIATEKDAKDILEIYKVYVLNTSISFETDVPSEEEMKQRISLTLEFFPWIVYEEEDNILGYAYASPFKSRCAYSWSVESTVYVKLQWHRKGIGRMLYMDLLNRLQCQGAINIIAGISLPNDKSVKLHESLGFKKVAQFKNVGFKHEKWWDVGYWQLEFSCTDRPEPLRAFKKTE